jgi:hypothetical protein
MDPVGWLVLRYPKGETCCDGFCCTNMIAICKVYSLLLACISFRVQNHLCFIGTCIKGTLSMVSRPLFSNVAEWDIGVFNGRPGAERVVTGEEALIRKVKTSSFCGYRMHPVEVYIARYAKPQFNLRSTISASDAASFSTWWSSNVP